MRALMVGWSKEERRRAQKAVDFFECELVHIEGELAGERFLLEQWQESVIRRLFGRLRADGTRQYRTAYIEIPRKNGKSTLAAGIAIYLLSEDSEPGAQVYSAAIDKAQASIVFDAARNMVESSPRLNQVKVLPFRGWMETAPGVCPGKPGKYRVLSADGQGRKSHGFNVSGAVIDEFHVQPKNSKVWSLIKTGTGSRRQPLIALITTAGDDMDTPCGEMHEKALAILKGKIKDDSFLPVIFAAEPEDDWTAEETWRKANPNLGVSVSLDYLREQCDEARRSPSYEATFRQLHLNQWMSVSEVWMPMDLWAKCGAHPIDPIAFKGQRCGGGLDLGSKRDLSALVLVFPRLEMVPATEEQPEHAETFYDVVCRFFMPRDLVKESEKRDRQPYARWAREGWLTLTAGNCISYEEIQEAIEEAHAFYHLRDLNYDRALTNMLIQILEKKIGEKCADKAKEEQLHLWPFGQGFVSMSDPTKTLLEYVRGMKIRHGNNPLLNWMMECVTVATDPAGNVKPVKPDVRSGAKRIDGVVSLVMALERAMRLEAERVTGGPGRSRYEDGEGLSSTRMPPPAAAAA